MEYGIDFEYGVYTYFKEHFDEDAINKLINDGIPDHVLDGYCAWKEVKQKEKREHYREYNPHPKKLNVGDCVKRAVCKAMDMDYMAVQRMLNRIKREIGEEDFRKVAVGKELARREGWRKIIFENMTAIKFCKEHPTGTYILDMPQHWVCCKDGVLYDTHNTLDKEVDFAWEVNEI